MGHFPFVSVVVPAFNEEHTLGACLDALGRQTWKGPLEVIVVDNASTDATPSVAAARGYRVVSEPRRGYVRAVTAGFRAAAGDIIASTDADTVVPPCWLERLVRMLQRPGVVGCGGVFVFSDGPPWLRLVGRVFGPLTHHISGANMAVWRSSFDAVGGFDPSVNLGADVDLDRRLRKIGRVIISRSLVVPTSSRRFARSFLGTVWRNYVNDFALIVLRRPLYRDFPSVRLVPRGGRSLRRRSSVAAKVTVPPRKGQAK